MGNTFENNFNLDQVEVSANLYEITVLILVIYCLFYYLVLSNILSAMLCSNFTKRAQRGYRCPWVKKENADHLRAKRA